MSYDPTSLSGVPTHGRERMDRMREENRKVFGEQSIAVELIRETRERR